MNSDIENKIDLKKDHEEYKLSKLHEFGDPQIKEFFQMQRLISPYHMPMIEEKGMVANLLVSVDKDFRLAYHSRKLVCKLRSLLHKDNSWVYYDEFKPEDDAFAKQANFVIQSLLI